MKLICEYCTKEYEYTPGQLNWGKNGLKRGRGSVNAKRYCCFECGKEAYKQHCKETNLKRYGVENPFQAEQFKEKIKQTCINRYGVDNSMKSKEIQKKSQETCLKNHGKKFPGQLEECLDKRKQTCVKKYGVEHPMRSDVIQKKLKQTKLEKYGNENYNNLEKAKQTMLKEYGAEYAIQVDFFKEKSKQTCIEKYGHEYSFQSDNNKVKAKRTKLEKYGDENYNNRDKAKKTNLETYGTDNPFKSDEVCQKVKKAMVERYGVEYYVLSEEFKDKAHATKLKNHSYGKSREEEKIFSLLCTKYEVVKRQYKSEKYPFHCDFYVPKIDLYIEYQGYWCHGTEPYNQLDPNHKKKIKLWENRMIKKHKPAYAAAISVWTIRDPLKRETAKKNVLNWIEFFTMEDFMVWYNSLP